MDWVNEGSFFIVTVSFYDEDGNSVNPDSIFYRINDLLSGQEIKENTLLDSESDSYDIEIPGDLNLILDSTNKLETRVLTIIFLYGFRTGTAEYRFWVKRLPYLQVEGQS